MAPKSIQQKKIDRNWDLLKGVVQDKIKNSFLGFWKPIKYLLSWLVDKVRFFSGGIVGLFRNVVPWLVLFTVIFAWFIAVVQVPARVWNLTPDFDSQAALSAANKLDKDISISEIKLAEQVTQAVLLERQGDFETALKKYQASEKSTLSITQTYVFQAIRRVQSRISNPLWQMLYGFNNFLIQTPLWIEIFFGALLALLALIYIYYQIPVKQGFAIGEFVTPKSIDKDMEYGLEVRQSLSDTIALIQLTHRTAQENLSLLTERLVLPSFGLSGSDKQELLQALIEIGDTPILQTTGISIAKLFNVFQAFSQRRRYLLSGSLNRLDGQWYLAAKMLDSRGSNLLNQWEIRQSELTELNFHTTEGSNPFPEEQNQDLDVIRNMSRALSYKIIFTILKQSAPSLEAKSWKSFYHLTEGLWGIQEYGIDSTAVNPRDRAVAHLEKLVNQLDYGNRIARFDLGLLYLMQGNVGESQLVFEYLKDSIDSRPEAILNKIYGNLIEDRSSQKNKSLIVKHLWKKYAKDVEELKQKDRGGELPIASETWKSLLTYMVGYVKSNGLDLFDEISIKSSLKLLFENLDTGKPLRRLVGFPEDISVEDATNAFMNLLDKEDGTDAIRLAKSIKGDDEATRADWEYISKILDSKHNKELSRDLDLLGSRVEFLNISLSFLEGNDKELIEIAKGFAALSKKAHSEVVSKISLAIANVLLDENLEKANEYYATLRNYMSEPNSYMAKIEMQQLLLKVNAPSFLWLYNLLQPEQTEDYVAFFEWQTSKRQPIYVETLYNLALSYYLSYSAEGYLHAVRCTETLMSHIKSNTRLAVDTNRLEELFSLAACLQVKSYVRAYLSHWDALYDFGRPSDDEKGFKFEELKKILEDIKEGHFHDIVTIESILRLTHHKSIDIQAAAYETLGIWHAYSENYVGQDHDLYFQSALGLRSWASSYIYLAESRAERKNFNEALRLLGIAKRQMPKLDYIEHLEKRWLAKIEEEKKAQVSSSTSDVDENPT